MSKFINLIAVSFLLLGLFFIPWASVKWGKVELLPASSVSVTGEASSQAVSQIASFTAGVSSVNDNKDTAVSQVNEKIAKLIEAIKNFGIDEADIKTQNLSIYQSEESYYEAGSQRSRPGQWRVSNELIIKLRDVNRSNELTNLLSGSGATNVYGPNFALDDTKAAEITLLEEAINNARAKASAIAKGSGKNLGEIINVAEGAVSNQPVLYSARMEGGGGGGVSLEPGTQTVSKTVTVTFELR